MWDFVRTRRRLSSLRVRVARNEGADELMKNLEKGHSWSLKSTTAATMVGGPKTFGRTKKLEGQKT